MQATAPQPMTDNGRTRRNLAYFLAPIFSGFLLLFVVLAVWLVSYQSRHNGRIFTGISVMGVDLSGLEMAEAEPSWPKLQSTPTFCMRILLSPFSQT